MSATTAQGWVDEEATYARTAELLADVPEERVRLCGDLSLQLGQMFSADVEEEVAA